MEFLVWIVVLHAAQNEERILDSCGQIDRIVRLFYLIDLSKFITSIQL